MSELVDLQELAPSLSKPFVVTRSTLGSTTKVLQDKFICTPDQVHRLHESIGEKVASFRPSKAGFQYLLSFTDNTHYENSDLDSLERTVGNSGKKSEKLILNWMIGHEYDGIENEMSITVRISNPVNPLIMLQAAMSRDHNDTDNMEFEIGSVSVSINGATQNTSEEIFSIVKRWIESCPQPASITGLNNWICENMGKISFINFWFFPIIFSICCYFILREIPQESVVEYSFLAFVAFMTIRVASQHINDQIRVWASNSRKFSMFLLTGGDENQQTKIAAKSRNSSLKLFFSVGGSFLLNVAAGITVALSI